jgi:acetolactate synthase I/II/III large subunit
MAERITGAEALIRALEHEHVELIFGYPGGCILPAYDPLMDSTIRHVLVRHEQGAGHMAEGYAHVSGRPGVAMVTSGPAATNLVTPLMDAYMDSVPMVAITGQVPTAAIGSDAFQECDTVGITRSCTKHNELVMSADDIPMAVRQAFHIATTGRPGPTLIDVPKDVLQNEMEWYWPTDEEVLASLPGYRPNVKGHPRMIKEAARMILASERPVIYAGGGILKARAAEPLRELAELIDTYVVTTLMARGAFPDDHPLCLGMPGMHGNATAVTAMQKSDLLITLGARFDDRITGKVDAFAPTAKVIHVDIDPAEQGKVRRPDVPIVGDAKYVIEEIIAEIKTLLANGTTQADTSAWKSKVSGWREQFPMTYEPSEPGGALKPQYCIEELSKASAPGTIVASGVGQHQMYTSQFFEFDEPYTWVNSGGLGTMGFSIPAAIGAKAARPDSTVWAVDGDGCFQMTAQELVTATVEHLPIKVMLLNNSYLGMVRQWQEMFYDERYSEVYLNAKVPDFVQWAEAMGCVGILVESPEEVGPAIEKANSINDRSVVIEFRTDAAEKVFPMVPAGHSNDDLILHPTQQHRAHGLKS